VEALDPRAVRGLSPALLLRPLLSDLRYFNLHQNGEGGVIVVTFLLRLGQSIAREEGIADELPPPIPSEALPLLRLCMFILFGEPQQK
jgi:hypothetical protein